MTIHREGYVYIGWATFLVILVNCLLFNFLPDWLWLIIIVNVILLPLWFWIVWFFRLPERDMTLGKRHVIAPADGKVVVIEETYEGEYFKDNRIQVSIFMSPLNVHINRSPIAGDVRFLRYHRGLYLVAWNPKSSTENERTTVVIGNDKYELLIRQIAGAVARRICLYTEYGRSLRQNEEFGFIRFGSRVDVFFPLGTKIDVKIGDLVQGGVTILASDVVDHHKKVVVDKKVVIA